MVTAYGRTAVRPLVQVCYELFRWVGGGPWKWDDCSESVYESCTGEIRVVVDAVPSEFKARVLEATRGAKTVQEIAAQYGVYLHQLSQWERLAQKSLAGVFEKPRVRGEPAVGKERARLAGH